MFEDFPFWEELVNFRMKDTKYRGQTSLDFFYTSRESRDDEMLVSNGKHYGLCIIVKRYFKDTKSDTWHVKLYTIYRLFIRFFLLIKRTCKFPYLKVYLCMYNSRTKFFSHQSTFLFMGYLLKERFLLKLRLPASYGQEKKVSKEGTKENDSWHQVLN